ncbi:MAG: sigma-54-dependent Fis family transcriptional regulator [Deltaproteobacteria bacterium]|nr:sigma-54-dependent Fis family transcriptional regulator [Deltaproteobacteria bacterium]
MREITTPLSINIQPPGRGKSESADHPPAHVLVVDDEPESLRAVARILKARGFEVDIAGNGVEALDRLENGAVDVMLIDLVMPGMSGLEVLKKAKMASDRLEVVMMTAFADVDTAVAAVKAGAYDFLTKPFPSSDTVALAVAKAAERGRLLDKTRRLEEELEVRERYGNIIGSSGPMLEVYRMIDSVSHSTSTVLLQGESGTGKELVARAIHSRGQRSNKSFVPVNCSAIPENLVESELFGHVRGAFTGAVSTRMGLFEAADGGTILLDEVGELPPQVQVKLLRTLQEGEVKRVGASESSKVDVRVVAATNVDLHKAMLDGTFREDLYYRLNVITVQIPPLRERIEDIPLLAYHFLRKYALRSGRDIRRISLEAMRSLRSYGWPGNVRELENAVERSVVMARGDVIMPGDLPQAVVSTSDSTISRNVLLDLAFSEAKKRVVEGFEKEYVQEVLRRAGGNVSEAARQASLDRSNFRRIVKKYNINQ